MEFGYWNCKGVSEGIRYLIAYLGFEWSEYNPVDKDDWAKKREIVGGDFPNLPYIADGENRITETSAIPMYLILKSGKGDLLGKDFHDQATVRMIEFVLYDVRTFLFDILFGGSHLKDMEASLAKGGRIHTKIEYFSKFLGDKEYLIGYLTWADFLMADLYNFSDSLARGAGFESPFGQHANLKAHMHRIISLPRVHALYAKRKEVEFEPDFLMPYHLLTTVEMEAQEAK